MFIANSLKTKKCVLQEYLCHIVTDDIREFLASCVHCVACDGTHRIQRALTHTLRATRPGEIIHFDFLCMGKAIVDHPPAPSW